MTAAAGNICSLGLEILNVHRSASAEAEEQPKRWKLEERQKKEVNPQLPDAMDASLFTLPVDTGRILFTVNEDPLFGHLTVTLLRAVPAGLSLIGQPLRADTLWSAFPPNEIPKIKRPRHCHS